MYRDCIEKKNVIIAEKYRILQEIGSGGFAKVYKVLDEHIGKEFAMKVVVVEKEEDAYSEPEFLRQLNHHGLPGLHDFFYLENYIYIIMELANGITLKEYVEARGKLTIKEGMHFARQLGEILQYLHTRPIPIIHGDLKPQNIMVGEEGICLIDFGGAFLQYDVGKRFVGTPGYAAPELRRGEIFTQSDVYAFGMVMLYLFTGREAYLFKKEGMISVLKKYGVSIKIRKILKQCLAEEVHMRFQSGQELLEAIVKEKSYMRHFPGRKFYICGIVLKICGIVGLLFLLYEETCAEQGLQTGDIFMNLCILFFGFLLIIFANQSYKTAILECECSIFVSEGISS